MEQLELKYDQLSQAVESLKKAIEYSDAVKHQQQTIFPFESQEEAVKTYNDSMIQRFEYTYDLLWKYLLKYLEKLENIRPEVRSPKNVFRECFKIGLISEQNVRDALRMVDDRNKTTHTYNEKLARQIAEQIPGYCKLIEDILKKSLPKV